MTKLLLTAGAAAALLAAPVLASAQTPSKGETQRTQSRQGRAADANTNNTQGKARANENAGFGAGAGGQNGGETGGQLREGMQVLDAQGNVIGVIVQVLRTRDGEIRQVKVRFDRFGRVMVKLVPKFQLKVKAGKALTDLVREQIEQLQDAPA